MPRSLNGKQDWALRLRWRRRPCSPHVETSLRFTPGYRISRMAKVPVAIADHHRRGWPHRCFHGQTASVSLNCDVLPLNIKGASRFLRKCPSATLDIEPPEVLWPETKGQAASLARVRGHPLHGAGGHGAAGAGGWERPAPRSRPRGGTGARPGGSGPSSTPHHAEPGREWASRTTHTTWSRRATHSADRGIYAG